MHGGPIFVVEVQHRREAEVHAAGAQLGAQHIAAGGGGVGGRQLVLDPEFTQRPHGRQVGEAVRFEALHAAAFMVDANQQVIAHAFDVGAQAAQLLAVLPVAAKQNDAAGQRVLEAAAVGLAERQAGDVDDQGGVLGHVKMLNVLLN